MERSLTVVFDLGEVLVPSTGVLPRLASELRVSEDELAAAYWPPRKAYDRGDPAAAYWTAVLEGLGRTPERDLLARLEHLDSTKWSTLPPSSGALLDRLTRDGVRLCVLSNAPAPLAAAVRAASWSAQVVHLVFSADAALLKPEPEIYAHADAVYGTSPGDVVFFDDRTENVEAARAHGWDAHVWVDPETALGVVARG
ncbi:MULTISPECIES: HAD family phosphatase [unclassified Pseudonocardia]|uniref:HAD family hydrolase n=1 Tax=unclassified Pseudonocardia TaxID=2619320 RepID=UPI001AD111B2|nr:MULTISPECIES: HAD family phosphatase [unclassified Pseudonocardia]MBN9103323.1 HAD family phosphatase [Pseudonocardia sp.]